MLSNEPLVRQSSRTVTLKVCTECGGRIYGGNLCSYECPRDNTNPAGREADLTYVAVPALVEIAKEMYEGMEIGSAEQLAVSEFLGRAESLCL